MRADFNSYVLHTAQIYRLHVRSIQRNVLCLARVSDRVTRATSIRFSYENPRREAIRKTAKTKGGVASRNAEVRKER